MTAREILNKAMEYRADSGSYKAAYVRFDLQAALDHALVACENCSHRFGSDPVALREALALLG